MNLVNFKIIGAARGSKAQYLTIDAFIASMIVAVALVIVLAAKSAQPYTTQSELVSKGFTETLTSSKLSELNNPLIVILAKNGTINNIDNTVLQQATEFYFTQRRHYAAELVKNVTYRLIPPQYSFKLLINNDLIYERVISNENTSAVLVSSKKLVFGVVNRTVLVYGPTIAEIRVWQ